MFVLKLELRFVGKTGLEHSPDEIFE